MDWILQLLQRSESPFDHVKGIRVPGEMSAKEPTYQKKKSQAADPEPVQVGEELRSHQLAVQKVAALQGVLLRSRKPVTFGAENRRLLM